MPFFRSFTFNLIWRAVACRPTFLELTIPFTLYCVGLFHGDGDLQGWNRQRLHEKEGLL